MLDHPANPPTTWHNLAPIAMVNPCIVAPGAVSIKKGQTLNLRYRVVAHDGAVPVGLLRKLSSEWRRKTGHNPFKLEPGFTRLDNGKDLTGWYAAGWSGQKTGDLSGWSVVDGAIHLDFQNATSHLFHEKKYGKNAVIRLQFRAILGYVKDLPASFHAESANEEVIIVVGVVVQVAALNTQSGFECDLSGSLAVGRIVATAHAVTLAMATVLVALVIVATETDGHDRVLKPDDQFRHLKEGP